MSDTKKAMEALRKKMEEPPKAGSEYLNKPRRTLEQAQRDIKTKEDAMKQGGESPPASSKEKGK